MPGSCLLRPRRRFPGHPLALALAGVWYVMGSGPAMAAESNLGEEQDDALFDSAVQAAPVPAEAPAGASEPPPAQPAQDALPTRPVAATPPAEPADAQSVEQAARERDEAPQWFGYQRAPIRWSGLLGLDYITTGETNSFLESLSLTGSSFVIAPYVAELTGSLYVTRVQVSAEQPSSSGSLAGAGILSLFNRSRWPLRITLDTGEASTTQSGVTNSSTSRSIGIDQSYRPEDASYVVTGRLGRSVFSSSNGDETVAGDRSFTYSPTLQTEMPQTFSASASYSGFDRQGANGVDARVATTQLNANHSINMEEWNGFRLATALTHNGLTDNASGGSSRSTDFTQISTGYTWVPEDPESRLTVSGAVSASRFASATEGINSTTDTYVATINAGHPLSDRWQSNYGAQAFYTINDLGTVTGQSATANLSYSSQSLRLGDYDYTWGVAGGGGAGSTSAGDESSSVNASAQHGLSRTVVSDDGQGTLGLNFTQVATGARIRGNVSGDSAALSNQGTLSWGRTMAEGTPMSGSLQVEDRRSWGLSASWSQSVRSALNAQRSLSWHEVLVATGTLDFVRQGSVQAVSTRNQSWVGAGFLGLTYQNQKTWGIPRLLGKLEYRLSAIPQATTGGGGDGVVLEHNIIPELNYRIGRLRFRALGMLRFIDGAFSHSLQLSINRDFGGTL